MVEWSITTVLKTVVLRGTGGSNPSLSAISLNYQRFTKFTPNFTPKNVKLGVYFLSWSEYIPFTYIHGLIVGNNKTTNNQHCY